MTIQSYDADATRKRPCPDMLKGLSLPALVELFDVPLKYLSVAGFEVVMFDCGGQYLVCTCSDGACVQARYSDTCAL
ncbi:MAG: hypothetical protein LWW87_01285 [Geobacteraceae bacterium]|nr:hypothetical protein [Geobacteraceae bacterium]